MAEALPATPESRVIRVFLSSTFRDFMEERDLLVKQVFPRLRKQAQERGVEVVDVDLRWGVTQEESEQGKVIGICLAEIDNCRPYFIGMLGERYGWIPPTDKFPALVLEQQAWLQQHVGGASVTELEILHGVLNDPKMAGRAFFYFRDPAWSRAQREPGFVCDTPEEEAKLAALKRRILSSDFPVKQGLADPKAIAVQIEADLWALIEEQYPDLDQADALEREARKHASYRQSRLGVYLGQHYVDQLEALISAGEQKILITGESGSGKSALIANWIHQHEQKHPDDVVYVHHLGCSNDANAIRPLLGRMLDTASKLLKEAELITEPIQVPQDWWELTAKVAETLQALGSWCKATGHRWIWVLDGLDRLAEDDQQALPWLPLLIPEGVSVLISALECPAKAIIQERQFQLLEIRPLQRNEQEQLIATYLERYTKKLDADRVEQILACDLARSPLFLRVLLEELRLCGRFETLEAQIADYIRPNADGPLSVNDLYARVLARLESDCGTEPVRQALTALWASRAGLSERELQAFTGLAPLQWAPIDLALEKALGRNGNRLVFDHDYLRIAVRDRYLPTEEQRRQAHSVLADWFGAQRKWDERKAEEVPWQLQKGGRTNDLRTLLLRVSDLCELARQLDDREVINYWRAAKAEDVGELDELIAEAVEEEIEKRKKDAADQIWFVDRIANLLDEAGLYRELLLRLRTLSLELEEAEEDRNEESMLSSLALLARAHSDMGLLDKAERLYRRCLETRERLLGPEHPSTLTTLNNLGLLYSDLGDYEQALACYERGLEASERLLGPEHPETLTTVSNLASVYQAKGDYKQAEIFYTRCLEAQERLLGPEHPNAFITLGNLAGLYQANGEYQQSETYYVRCLESCEKLLGREHPETTRTINNLGLLYSNMGDYEQALACYERALEASGRLLGPEHPDTLTTLNNLATLLRGKGDYEQAKIYHTRCLESQERLLGPEHPSTLATIENLGDFHHDTGDYEQAKAYYTRCLEARERLLGPEHPDTLTPVCKLGLLYKKKGDNAQADVYYTRSLEAQERLLGPEHPDTLATLNNLANLFQQKGDYVQAKAHHIRCLEARERLLGPEHPSTLTTLNNLGLLYHDMGDYEQALTCYERVLEASERLLGPEHPATLTTVGNFASVYQAKGDYKQAEVFYTRCLEAQERLLGPEHPNTLINAFNLADLLTRQERHAEAIPLRRRELAWCREQDGDTDPGTLTSINGLAIDLRETGELAEAEALFRELLAARQQVLEPSDFGIGRALGGLAKTLEEAGKLEEASTFAQKALNHSLDHEGPDAWWTNRKRLDLARVLHKLGRSAEATQLLDALQASITSNAEPDDDDRQLLADAATLRAEIEANP